MRFVLFLLLTGCALESSGIVVDDGGPERDAGGSFDAGRVPPGVDAGMRDAGMRDAGRDAGMSDAGRDAGGPPVGCEARFSDEKGFQAVCMEADGLCVLFLDRSGGTGTNGRSCSDICAAEDDWICAGSGGAGGGGSCLTVYSPATCLTPFNTQVCVCRLP